MDGCELARDAAKGLGCLFLVVTFIALVVGGVIGAMIVYFVY